MKRKAAVFLVLSLFIVLLASCGRSRPCIEEYEWHLKSAMRVENNQLVVVATDGADNLHPEAIVVDVVLVASNGNITIQDKTNKKTYTGTYKTEGKTPDGAEYSVKINGLEGRAGAAMTTYYDGTKEPTLPISIGGYSLYFYA